jgi:hypothetical protein
VNARLAILKKQPQGSLLIFGHFSKSLAGRPACPYYFRETQERETPNVLRDCSVFVDKRVLMQNGHVSHRFSAHAELIA